MAKQLLFDDIARTRVLRGVDKLADVVAVTMGPTGRNVILGKSFGGPTVHQGRGFREQGSRA